MTTADNNVLPEGLPAREPLRAAVLEAKSLSAGYGDLAVMRDLNLTIAPGQIVALLGPNGAGKSTLLRTLAGLLKPLSGEVWFDGQVAKGPLHRRARAGLAYIADDRSLIPDLTVRDNLRLAKVDVNEVIAEAPVLGRLINRRAGLLSGGEQQLLSVVRALSRKPKILLVDELSQGLSPLAVEEVWALLRTTAMRGTAVLAVEQVIGRALDLSHRFVVLRQGTLALEGDSLDYRDKLAEIERLHVVAASGR
ncbi:ATP-binding cassette domain-containing protein [Microbacterium sp. zg-YB36]|uniref:ABC transporter ATP-binding protein n=1 Tax=Microbacterium sp. zg-YB36 TaxID=2969407 RepID=UPI00214B357F|nr:ATP-binding cassette domain-containing protein [Microbacterium sp. zg-YB36]MDL5352124.1 ATP-binding cassette domain-containing protein [Microbacterium sp. zg-YB36]